MRRRELLPIGALAGDGFRDTPLRLRLLAFQAVYYLNNLFNPRRWLMAAKKRRIAIQA